MEWVWTSVIILAGIIVVVMIVKYIKSQKVSDNELTENHLPDPVSKEDIMDVMKLLECLDEIYKTE
ncbi:MAG: hypothetical protein IIT39_16855 [Clostridia bacterium]|nr:hypothetical protein [Clostridia bacterium]